MSYFEEMDDMEFGAKLFESEMENDINEEEAHAKRCIAKGKRAKNVKTQKLLWYRKHKIEERYDPHYMNLRNCSAKRRNTKVRRDTLNAKHEAMTVNPEEYDTVDAMPAKARRY